FRGRAGDMVRGPPRRRSGVPTSRSDWYGAHHAGRTQRPHARLQQVSGHRPRAECALLRASSVLWAGEPGDVRHAASPDGGRPRQLSAIPRWLGAGSRLADRGARGGMKVAPGSLNSLVGALRERSEIAAKQDVQVVSRVLPGATTSAWFGAEGAVRNGDDCAALP